MSGFPQTILPGFQENFKIFSSKKVEVKPSNISADEIIRRVNMSHEFPENFLEGMVEALSIIAKHDGGMDFCEVMFIDRKVKERNA